MLSARRAIALAMALGAAGSVIGCGIPEQTLRDEQVRTRRYRDAYESEHEENQALRARTDDLQKQLAVSQGQQKKCAAAEAPAAH